MVKIDGKQYLDTHDIAKLIGKSRTHTSRLIKYQAFVLPSFKTVKSGRKSRRHYPLHDVEKAIAAYENREGHLPIPKQEKKQMPCVSGSFFNGLPVARFSEWPNSRRVVE